VAVLEGRGRCSILEVCIERGGDLPRVRNMGGGRLINLLAEQFSMKLISEGKE